MPRFIQTIDSNGNKIINIPEINAGNQNSLNIKADNAVSSNSDKFEVNSPTSILLTSNGTGSGEGEISINAKQTLRATGEGSTIIGSSTSATNINASTLNERSSTHNIVTPTLNINNGVDTTTLTSKSSITNTGTLENTGNVDVTGDTTLEGDLTVKSSSTDEGTIVTSSSITFNNTEEILNKGKLTIAGDKSGSVYSVGSIESHENITNTGTIENTGDVTIKNSTLKIEEGSKSISLTKDSIDSGAGVTLFKNQTVKDAGTSYTYNDKTIVNFEGTTNLDGPTTATANVAVKGADLSVTGNTTLTGNTTATGGVIELGDDAHTTTIKGSTLTVSSPESLKFSPSVKVSASIDGTNPLVIEPGKISRTGSGNDLLIDAPNTTIKSGATSHIEGATVEVKDSTNSGGLTSSAGTTTLFGNSSVGISSSAGSVGLSSKTTMDLEGEGNVSVKSTGTGSSLNLGQAGNATNINGSKITLTHGSNNSVDVISKLVVKESESTDVDGVEITGNLIKGANSQGLEVESSTVTVQGNTSVGIKSPSITAGPISNNPSDNQVTINTTAKSLTVNNSTTGITTSETTSVNAKQITLTSTGTGNAGKTVVNGGLKVAGGAEVDTLNATTSLTTPEGNITILKSTTGNITTVNSDQANFANQIKIKDLVIRYDSVAKALIFETAGA